MPEWGGFIIISTPYRPSSLRAVHCVLPTTSDNALFSRSLGDGGRKSLPQRGLAFWLAQAELRCRTPDIGKCDSPATMDLQDPKDNPGYSSCQQIFMSHSAEHTLLPSARPNRASLHVAAVTIAESSIATPALPLLANPSPIALTRLHFPLLSSLWTSGYFSVPTLRLRYREFSVILRFSRRYPPLRIMHTVY